MVLEKLMKPVPKAPNYTEDMVKEIVGCYTTVPTRETIDLLADKYNKSPRSIIAKLSNLGIYKVPERTTKTGAPIVKKDTMVQEICNNLGIKADSLIKVTKRDLESLANAINEVING